MDGQTPKEDVLISGHHRVIVRVHNQGEGMFDKYYTAIPAKDLDISEKFLQTGEVDYYHLQVEEEDGFFVSGLAVESFTRRHDSKL